MEFQNWFNSDHLLPTIKSIKASAESTEMLFDRMTDEEKEQYMTAIVSLLKVADDAMSKAWLIAYEVVSERQKAERSENK